MKKLTIYILAFLSLIITSPADARLRIDVTSGNSEPLPIALPGLAGSNARDSETGRDIMKVVENNLDRTALFRFVNKDAFLQRFSFSDTIPNFPDWRQINSHVLVTGTIKRRSDGKVETAFRLWDIYGGQQITGKSYVTDAKNWRRVGHLISDEIYHVLTGEKGYFDSRVVYVAESGPKKKRVKRLALMDQDGGNHKFLTRGKNLVLTPRFSTKKHEIIYLSYGRGVPKVRLRNIETGREEVLGKFPGMTFAPRFSADGRRVIMSVAYKGNTEIYELNIGTRGKKRITNNPAIDTSPYYSPGGRQMVFNSDRGGSQQLYIMNSNGGNIRRLSYGSGNYSTPVWAPNGKYIAFTKMQGGQFSIGIIRPDGTGERMLTSGFLLEGPTWAPNSRVVMYTKQRRGGEPKLYTIDITGTNERELVTPIGASDATWSPLLH